MENELDEGEDFDKKLDDACKKGVKPFAEAIKFIRNKAMLEMQKESLTKEASKNEKNQAKLKKKDNGKNEDELELG